MKILADVHIARRVVRFFKEQGFEAVHVNDILDSHYTKDAAISIYADEHDFMLITKDADFKDSHFLQNTPKKLLKISLGNIPTSDLLELLQTHLVLIQAKNELSKFFIEINPDRLWIIE